MNSRVGRLGGHSHDSRNLTFLFRSREATTHAWYRKAADQGHAKAQTNLEWMYNHGRGVPRD